MPTGSGYDYSAYEIRALLVWREAFTGVANNYPRKEDEMVFEKIRLYQGDNRTFQIYVTDKSGNPINIAGGTAVMTWKTSKSATSSSLSLSTEVSGEGEIGSGDEGEAIFYISPSDTSSLDIRQYVWDVRVTLSNGKIYTVVDGVVDLLEPVA